jgi:hypothetical protein
MGSGSSLKKREKRGAGLQKKEQKKRVTKKGAGLHN